MTMKRHKLETRGHRQDTAAVSMQNLSQPLSHQLTEHSQAYQLGFLSLIFRGFPRARLKSRFAPTSLISSRSFLNAGFPFVRTRHMNRILTHTSRTDNNVLVILHMDIVDNSLSPCRGFLVMNSPESQAEDERAWTCPGTVDAQDISWGAVASDIPDPQPCINRCQELFFRRIVPNYDRTNFTQVCEHVSEDEETKIPSSLLRELYCCDSALCGVFIEREGEDRTLNEQLPQSSTKKAS